MLYALEDKHNAESNSAIRLFLSELLPREQLPPSLPSRPLSLFPLHWGLLGSSTLWFPRAGLERTTFPSCTQRAESGKVTAFCTFTSDRDQVMPTCRRKTPLLFTHPVPPRSAAELWAGSAERAAEQDSGKAVSPKDLVTTASRCSASTRRPEALYEASHWRWTSLRDGRKDSAGSQGTCPTPSKQGNKRQKN